MNDKMHFESLNLYKKRKICFIIWFAFILVLISDLRSIFCGTPHTRICQNISVCLEIHTLSSIKFKLVYFFRELLICFPPGRGDGATSTHLSWWGEPHEFLILFVQSGQSREQVPFTASNMNQLHKNIHLVKKMYKNVKEQVCAWVDALMLWGRE